MRRWLSWLRSDPITPLEKAILDAVRQHLSTEAQAVWDQQREAIGYSQCVLGKEVNYYLVPDASVQRFPHAEHEVRRIATVRFERDGVPYKARVYLVEGRLFSIEFDRDIRRLRKQQSIRVVSVDLHADPMQASAPVPQPEVVEGALARSQFRGWLAKWAERHPIEQVLETIPSTDREQLLQRRRLQNLPQDYKELLEECDGFVGADYTVLGVSDMYEIALGDEIYWVLAERGGGFVVAREGDNETRVYFVHHEEGAPSQVFRAFREALEYLLGRQDLP